MLYNDIDIQVKILIPKNNEKLLVVVVFGNVWKSQFNKINNHIGYPQKL